MGNAIYALLGIGALLAISGNAFANYAGGNVFDKMQNPPTSEPGGPSTDDKIAAFLAMIRDFESGGDYFILYGGSHFSDTSRHPQVRIPFRNPRTGKMDYSTAAGAYQINWPTYQQFAPMVEVTDFSPASQDLIAMAILYYENVVDKLAADDIPGALRAASSRWASLPYSTDMQGPQSLQTALNTYAAYVGQA